MTLFFYDLRFSNLYISVEVRTVSPAPDVTFNCRKSLQAVLEHNLIEVRRSLKLKLESFEF
jgi:hypothetical protein